MRRLVAWLIASTDGFQDAVDIVCEACAVRNASLDLLQRVDHELASCLVNLADITERAEERSGTSIADLGDRDAELNGELQAFVGVY